MGFGSSSRCLRFVFRTSPRARSGSTKSNLTATVALLAERRMGHSWSRRENLFTKLFPQSPKHEEERFWQGFGVKGCGPAARHANRRAAQGGKYLLRKSDLSSR